MASTELQERRFMWSRTLDKYYEVVRMEHRPGHRPERWCADGRGGITRLVVMPPNWVLVSYNEAVAGRLRGARVVFRTTE